MSPGARRPPAEPLLLPPPRLLERACSAGKSFPSSRCASLGSLSEESTSLDCSTSGRGLSASAPATPLCSARGSAPWRCQASPAVAAIDDDPDDWTITFLAEVEQPPPPAEAWPSEGGAETPELLDGPERPRDAPGISEADMLGLSGFADLTSGQQGEAASSVRSVNSDTDTSEFDEHWQDWQTAGLRNVGNTCFMGAGLQCLTNVAGVRDVFLSRARRRPALSTADQGGSQRAAGRLADGFAAIVRRMWSGDATAGDVCPRDFKALVDQLDDRFVGCAQHDAMEFLEFLLDGLREDLNTVVGKGAPTERPDSAGRCDQDIALEEAARLLTGSDSEIDSLFVGLFKSTTTCPRLGCGHGSVVFDPFLSVKVPVLQDESERKVWITLTLVPHRPHRTPARLGSFCLPEGATVGHLIDVVAAAAADVEASRCVLAEIFMSRVYSWFERDDPICEICESDVLVVYEEAENPAADQACFPVLHVGDVVVTRAAVRCGDENDFEIAKGTFGRVVHFDEGSDVRVQFDGSWKGQLVLRENHSRLAKVLSATSAERREDPETGTVYTPSEYASAFGEEYTWSSLMEYWRDDMFPVDSEGSDKDADDASQPAFQKVLLHFANVYPDAVESGAQRKLFGFPIPILVPWTDNLADSIKAAAQDDLERRFGVAAPLDDVVLLWASRACDLPRTRVTLDEAMPGPRKHREGWLFVVAQWGEDRGPPDEVARPLAQLMECRMAQEEVDLRDCLQQLCAPEILGEGEGTTCSACGERGRATHQLGLWSAPPTLILQLKRFEYSDFGRRKVGVPVRFPLEGLDLTSHCSAPGVETFPPSHCLRAGCQVESLLDGSRGRMSHFDAAEARFVVDLEGGGRLSAPRGELIPVRPQGAPALAEPQAIYDLSATCVHIGSAAFGHYVAYARSCEDGLWRFYNDGDVVEVDRDEVEEEKAGTYLLFYIRRDHRPATWGPPAHDNNPE